MIVHVNPADKSGLSVCTPEDALALLRKSDGEKKMIIEAGVYYGTRLHLTAEDSGLVIEGTKQGRAVLSGGVPVRDWRLDEQTGWFVADVPSIDGKQVDFRLLLSEKGDYLKKARYPLEGVLHHRSSFTKLVWRGSCFGGWGRMLHRDEIDNFVYNPDDFSEDFVYENAEVQIYHQWNESYTAVVGMDRETNTFYLDPPCGHPVGSFGRTEYIVYNTIEGMAEDGRWYRDKKQGLIYYRPFAGQKVEDFCAIVPITHTVILLDDGCENITVKDVDVTAASTAVVTDLYSTEVMRGAGGFLSLEQSGAIQGEGLKNIRLENLHVYKTGGLAIKIKGENVYVLSAQITECGAGGVALTNTAPIPENPTEALLASWPRVEGCRIDNIGVDYYSAAAIFINNAVACRNYIENTPYSGIVAYGDNILIEENVILNPMQKLDDGAGIYKLLDNKGVIRNNYVERRFGSKVINCKGLYLDAPGVDFTVSGNVVKGFPYALHYHIAQPGTVYKNNYFEYDGDFSATFHRSQEVHLIDNVFKCTGKFTLEAPIDCIAEFKGNVIVHGGEGVFYKQTKFLLTEKDLSPIPFEADETNRIQMVNE